MNKIPAIFLLFTVLLLTVLLLRNTTPFNAHQGDDLSTQYLHILELFDAFDMDELAHRTISFFSGLKVLTQQCSHGNTTLVKSGLVSLSTHKLTEDIMDDNDIMENEDFKLFSSIMSNPEMYLSRNPISSILPHLENYKTLVSNKICNVMIAVTAEQFKTALENLKEAANAVKYTFQKFPRLKSEVDQLQFSINRFVQQLNKGRESPFLTKNSNRARIALAKKAVEVIRKYKTISEKFETDLEKAEEISTISQFILNISVHAHQIALLCFSLLAGSGLIYLFHFVTNLSLVSLVTNLSLPFISPIQTYLERFVYANKFVMGIFVGVVCTCLTMFLLWCYFGHSSGIKNILEQLVYSMKDLQDLQRVLLASCMDS